MRYVMVTTAAALLLALSLQSFAQDAAQSPPNEPQSDAPEAQTPDTQTPEARPRLEFMPDILPLEDGQPLELAPTLEDLKEEALEAEAKPAIEKPDYSRLPESEERKVRLDALFERLKAEENAEAANLIAEEIWAIWLDSGSSSIDLLLRRGTAAQKSGNDKLARRMYNHVIELSPDYAEGWARSARLAYEEEDLSRALTEATQALILEPRQFYAHWTLGNIFEKIGRTEAAYEAYKEANRLYPELMPVKDRLELMQGQVEGDVL